MGHAAGLGKFGRRAAVLGGVLVATLAGPAGSAGAANSSSKKPKPALAKVAWTAPAGLKVTITGRASNAPSGAKVRLQRRAGTKWKLAATGKPSGKQKAFTLAWTAPAVGSYRLRLTLVSGKKTLATKSKLIKLTPGTPTPTPDPGTPTPTPDPAPTATPAPAPAPPTPSSSGTQLVAGGRTTCALQGTGTANCWGANTDGQLGIGTADDDPHPTPAPVTGLTDATAIATGGRHTCAVHSTGAVSCWGNNDYGQLGDDSTVPRATPVAVSDITDATAIAAGARGGGYEHTCALHSNQTVSCWGYNNSGQLGNSHDDHDPHPKPLPVTGLTDATAITAGYEHTCALRSTGEVSCWGMNSDGELGDDSTTSRNAPVAVKDLTDATAITAGLDYTCALRSNQTVSCWGNNELGQLGDDSTTDRDKPVAVKDLTDAIAISTSYGHTCALRSNQTVSCWGLNGYGQLGIGTSDYDAHVKPVPIPTENLTDATAITAGWYHTCVMLTTGGAKCWGNNGYGQLGNGSASDAWLPVAVVGLP
ncbi:MAG: hypothetical protein QM679_00110 [Patulibacter sp.]